MHLTAVHDDVTSPEELAEFIFDIHAGSRPEGWEDGIVEQLDRSAQYRLVTALAQTLHVYAATDAQRIADYSRQSSPPPLVYVWEFGCPNPEITLLDGAHRALAARPGDELDLWVPDDAPVLLAAAGG